MPIYEYVCRECGEQVERLQRMSDDPLTDCPACAQPSLKRKVSAAGFRLSGGGWYETDFKSDGQRNLTANKDESSSSKPAGGGSGDTAKSDSAGTAKKEGTKSSGDGPKTKASSGKSAAKSEG